MDNQRDGILRKLLLAITHSKPWHWALKYVVPYIRFSVYYPRYRGINYIIASRIMTPGQFILCLDEQKGTSFLIPGFMSHVEYVVNNCMYSNNTEHETVGMTHSDFTKSFLFDTCKENSRILICDCIDWTNEHKKKMIEAVSLLKDAKYDESFEFGIKSLYCSELIYQLDRLAAHPDMTDVDLNESKIKGLMQVDLSDFLNLGQEYISPDGLLFAKNTRVVWDSDAELTGLLGPDAEIYCKEKGYIK